MKLSEINSRRLLGGASLLVLSLAGVNAAQAQTAPASENSDEIVVTGFRASLASALNQKRSATAAIDVINAEDIADFPDANLAESLQRVPGVSINRVAGEGRAVTVRGLNGSFSRVRVNGMEAQSTSGATVTDRGANAGRGFDFNTFASELFNSLSVRKTASADVIEGSLGATVDLQTARPFDYPDGTVVLNAQLGYNTLSEDNDRKASFVASDRWDTGIGEVGALFSVAYSQRNYLEDQFGSGGWNPASSTDQGFCTPVGFAPQTPATGIQGSSPTLCATGVTRPAANDPTFAAANRSVVFFPRLPRYGRFIHDQRRLGATLSLQWRPNDTTELDFDAVYSNYDVERDEQWLEAFSFARGVSANGKPQTAVRELILRDAGPSTFPAPGVEGVTVYDVDYARFDGVDIRSDNRHDEFENTFTQYTLAGTTELTDRLTFRGMIGASKSDFDQPISTELMVQRRNAGMTLDFRRNRDQPIITHDFDVTNPNLFSFTPPDAGLSAGDAEIRLNQQFITNTYDTIDLSFEFAALEGLTLRAGAHYDVFSFDISQRTRNGNSYSVPPLTGTAFSSLTTLVTGFGDGFDSGVFPSSWVAIDHDKFAASQGIYSETGAYAMNPVTGGTRSAEEDVTAFYLQAEFEIENFLVPIRGDIGLRHATTNLSSTGFQVRAGTPSQVTVKTSYEDLLPSANLVFELSDDLLFRLSAASVMSRPELGFLTPGGSVTLGGAQSSISSGNPFLEPIRAKTYDASVEWYFADSSLLSVALFYKDIESYVQTRPQQLTFNQTGLPLALLGTSGINPDTELFLVSQPVNTPGGPLEGYEISYQQAFSSLPGLLANTGAILNYTHVESDISFFLPSIGTSVTTQSDILGLSRNAANATIYYDDSTFSARISAAYRDKYTIALPANNPLQDLEGVSENLTFDLSAAYQLTENIRFTVEGLNITDEFNRQFIDTGRDSTFVYGHLGAQWNVGVQYKF